MTVRVATVATSTINPGTCAPAIARCALRALHAELILEHKPGLVSPRSTGAHSDMDASTFMRSLFSLRRYFRDICVAGAHDQGFSALRALGIAAESRMLRATGGINTHRGAIFSLGLLAAAAARHGAREGYGDPLELSQIVRQRWGGSLAIRSVEAGEASHGEMVGSRFGLGGARQEAARGFPSVFGCALPALRKARARGASVGQARLHALYSLAASLDDTNVYHRGGAQAARFLQDNAREFLVAGSVFAAGWRERAKALDAECVARRISPGGCADLLAATIFVDSLDADSRTAQ